MVQDTNDDVRDKDVLGMSPEELIWEILRLRKAIRDHHCSEGDVLSLCYLLPERFDR